MESLWGSLLGLPVHRFLAIGHRFMDRSAMEGNNQRQFSGVLNHYSTEPVTLLLYVESDTVLPMNTRLQSLVLMLLYLHRRAKVNPSNNFNVV
jgi:hypothetical protein